jgi:hypothetical protein
MVARAYRRRRVPAGPIGWQNTTNPEAIACNHPIRKGAGEGPREINARDPGHRSRMFQAAARPREAREFLTRQLPALVFAGRSVALNLNDQLPDIFRPAAPRSRMKTTS